MANPKWTKSKKRQVRNLLEEVGRTRLSDLIDKDRWEDHVKARAKYMDENRIQPSAFEKFTAEQVALHMTHLSQNPARTEWKWVPYTENSAELAFGLEKGPLLCLDELPDGMAHLVLKIEIFRGKWESARRLIGQIVCEEKIK